LTFTTSGNASAPWTFRRKKVQNGVGDVVAAPSRRLEPLEQPVDVHPGAEHSSNLVSEP
jgi:hypothetical protein